MTVERAGKSHKRKTCVRRGVKMGTGFNTGWGVTFRYQARIDPPLRNWERRKGDAGTSHKEGITLSFLSTRKKRFPTVRCISAQSWGAPRIARQALSPSATQRMPGHPTTRDGSRNPPVHTPASRAIARESRADPGGQLARGQSVATVWPQRVHIVATIFQKSDVSSRLWTVEGTSYLRTALVSVSQHDRTHLPLPNVVDRKNGGVDSPPGSSNQIFLSTPEKRFPTTSGCAVQRGGEAVFACHRASRAAGLASAVSSASMRPQ